jgi:U3 small nucleolar RNA-associated protein 6
MAEKAFFHLEQILPYFKELNENKVFSDSETKQMLHKIKENEFKINRKQAIKQDFLSYLKYLKTLISLTKKRTARLKVEFQIYKLVKIVDGLYKRLLLKFNEDLTIWVEFISWLKGNKSTKLLGQTFAKAVQLHPNVSYFWVDAAEYEFNENNNVQSARILLQRGIRLNPESKSLWIEYFKLELLWIKKVGKRNEILLNEASEFDKTLNDLLIPKAIYKNAIKGNKILKKQSLKI